MQNYGATEKNPKDWRVEQIVVLDWYDGPIEGFISILGGCHFHYKLIAEKFNSEDLDDRYFRFIRITPDEYHSVIQILFPEPSSREVLGSHLVPRELDPQHTRQLQRFLDGVRHRSSNDDLVVWTQDMKQFLAAWRFSDWQPPT